MVKRYGQRTPAFLDDLGYLDGQLLAVHLTEATDEEATLIAQRGARMALCSGSIGLIDGIVPPAQAFRAAGGLVALGSDQASGNNEVHIALKLKQTDAKILQAIEEALERIDNGTYGVCRDCSKPIARARLDAIPWTRVCITCKEKQSA